MKHIRWIARFIAVAVLSFSLIFTGLSFVSGAAITALSQALFALTGVRSQALQQADDLVKLRGELADEKAQRLSKERLEREARQELVSKTDELARLDQRLKNTTLELTEERTQRQAAEAAERQVRARLDDADRMVRIAQRNALATTIDTADGTVTIKAALKSARSRVADKTEKMAKRGVTGMAAEAVPYFGTAAIVGLTALDIKDLCEMARSSNELYYSIFEEDRPNEDDPTVCSISVPTRTELWDMAKRAPGQAFIATKQALPELEDIRQIDNSDLWSFGLAAVEKASQFSEDAQSAAKLTWGTLVDLWRDWNR